MVKGRDGLKIVYKGVLCETGYERIMGESVPALFLLDSPNSEKTYEAGFEEMHYGRWVKLLTETEFKEVLDLIEKKYM
ncbi:hypothetical protein B5E82_08925 [Lachnoclostridium sp. An138]|nr:hypothetical protein B5E82_08925 [Lachnoclostridium sp. An138]